MHRMRSKRWGDVGQIVCGDDHDPPFVPQGLEDLHDVLLGGNVDATEGFVHEDYLGVLSESAGYENPLPLAS